MIRLLLPCYQIITRYGQMSKRLFKWKSFTHYLHRTWLLDRWLLWLGLSSLHRTWLLDRWLLWLGWSSLPLWKGLIITIVHFSLGYRAIFCSFRLTRKQAQVIVRDTVAGRKCIFLWSPNATPEEA